MVNLAKADLYLHALIPGVNKEANTLFAAASPDFSPSS